MRLIVPRIVTQLRMGNNQYYRTTCIYMLLFTKLCGINMLRYITTNVVNFHGYLNLHYANSPRFNNLLLFAIHKFVIQLYNRVWMPF